MGLKLPKTDLLNMVFKVINKRKEQEKIEKNF